MKKIYIILSAITFAFTGFTQAPVNKSRVVINQNDKPFNNKPTEIKVSGDMIGSLMDFSNPADWVATNVGSPPANWVIGTVGPTGFFSASMGAITSTSGGNFAMFDSDALGNASSAQDARLTMANSVDLTGFNNVAFEFESYYRNFQGETFIEVSNVASPSGDGDWTQFQVHSTILLNEGTDNPQVTSVNISSVAGNEATVWVRFRYVGEWDYAWMVDDARFVEGYDDNIAVQGAFMKAGPQELDYYIIPSNQITPITFEVDVENLGINAQTNTNVTVTATGGYSENSTPATIAAFTTETFLVNTAFTPAGAGTYTIDFSTSADATDQEPSNNSMSFLPITVGGNVYARDNGFVTGSVRNLGETNVETLMGNIFDIITDCSIGKIQVGLGAGTVVNEEFFVEIRRWNGTEYVYLEGSDMITVQAGQPGTIVEVNLNSLVNLFADDDILILAGHNGQDIFVQTAQISEGAVIFNAGALSQQNSLFIVRGVYDFVSIDENSNEEVMLSAYPNPASDNLTITYSVFENSNVELTIYNVAGELVYFSDQGNKNQGKYNINLSAEDFSNGVYFYTLNVNGTPVTKKLVIANR